MPRFNSNNFIKMGLKLRYFSPKLQNFLEFGAPPQGPLAPGGIFAKCTYTFTTYWFFSLTRVKYGTLMSWQRRFCGLVEVRARVWQVSRLSSISAALFHFFSSEPCIWVRVTAAMPAWEIDLSAKTNLNAKTWILFTIMPPGGGDFARRPSKQPPIADFWPRAWVRRLHIAIIVFCWKLRKSHKKKVFTTPK